MTIDPGTMSDEERAQAGIVRPESTRRDALDALEHSEGRREILGGALLEALVAVRRHEVVVGEACRSMSWSNGSVSPGRSET